MPASRRIALLLAAFVALKTVEIVGRVESWPLTRVPMFSAYRGPTDAPWAVRLEGLQSGRWRPFDARELTLTRDELLRRIQGDANAISLGCGRLWRSFNAARALRAPIVAMRVRLTRTVRPGVPESPAPAEVVVPCR